MHRGDYMSPRCFFVEFAKEIHGLNSCYLNLQIHLCKGNKREKNKPKHLI